MVTREKARVAPIKPTEFSGKEFKEGCSTKRIGSAGEKVAMLSSPKMPAVANKIPTTCVVKTENSFVWSFPGLLFELGKILIKKSYHKCFY
jgi:hypothetical protein